MTDTAVETLRARGEPARFERLLGEILVGLDRAGQLRRLATATLRPGAARDPRPNGETSPPRDGRDSGPRQRPSAAAPDGPRRTGTARRRPSPSRRPAASRRRGPRRDAPDAVERLLALIRDELGRPTQRRLTEIEPGRWWLADRDDRAAAATPLADRVEWAVFSLLSTAGPISETAFFERIATMFTGHDLPDEALSGPASRATAARPARPDRLVTGDDLLRRSQEHTELLATHRRRRATGSACGSGSARREQTPAAATGGLLGDLLDDREERLASAGSVRPRRTLAEVDAIWYVRGKVAFLFEVEWTAMLGEPLLRRHARIPPDDDLIRFLVIAPERTELVRYKLERSPLLRAALEAGTWHILKSDHLRAFLAARPARPGDLEPLPRPRPAVERERAEQMPLF